MARIKCAISGLELKVSHMPMHLSSFVGYYHPIFVLPHKKLFGLYAKHCKNELTNTESYLLFLAFLHSTGQVEWQHHATLDPEDSSTFTLIQNNIAQLIRVVETTSIITLPSFKQPSFVVSKDNSKLRQIPNWIAAWEENLEAFKNNNRLRQLHEDIVKIENKLTWYIKSGLEPQEYITVVANWAEKVAQFPKHKAENWKRIIRSCFNSEKMFSTSLAELKELKAWCEDNIEPGSIHFHTLYEVINTGIDKHSDFLGLSPIALGYTLLSEDGTKTDTALEIIKANAPENEPQRKDYSSDFEYLKAKLRYRMLHAAK